MRKLSEIKAFEDEFELFEMDAARVIGKAVRSGGQQGKQAELLWGEVMGTQVHEQLVALPDVIADSLVGYMCEEQARTALCSTFWVRWHLREALCLKDWSTATFRHVLSPKVCSATN